MTEEATPRNAGEIESLDIKVGTKLAEKRRSPLVKAASSIGKLGDQEPLYFMGFAAALAGSVGGNAKLRNTGLAMVAHVAAADLAKQVVKKYIKRTRPARLLDHGHYEAEVGEKRDEKDYNSFPSGHVACTLAGAYAVGNSYAGSRPYGTAATAVIAAARLTKGAHWPMDVLGGILVGWVTSAVTSAIVNQSFLRNDSGSRP